jgi:hypothetical protein
VTVCVCVCVYIIATMNMCFLTHSPFFCLRRYFGAVLFAVLVAVCPAVVRVAYMIYRDTDDNLRRWKTFNTPEHLCVFKRNVLVILVWGSFLGPLLCCLPMLIFNQLFGDTATAVCFLAFSVLPVVATKVASRPDNAFKSYVLFLVRISRAHRSSRTFAMSSQSISRPLCGYACIRFLSHRCIC